MGTEVRPVAPSRALSPDQRRGVNSGQLQPSDWRTVRRPQTPDARTRRILRRQRMAD